MARVAARNSRGNPRLWTTTGRDCSWAQFRRIPVFKGYRLAIMQLLRRTFSFGESQQSLDLAEFVVGKGAQVRAFLVFGLVRPYAALPAVILWVVELSTLNVRMTGSPSMRCRIISWMAGYCSRW